jgi:antitoxin VapB
MPLELKSAKADALARELATATGEDIETAVERAIEERLARIPRHPRTPKPADIDAIFDRLAQMPVLDERTPEEIIGYDKNGVPV